MLVHQLKPRVEIIPVEKIQCGFRQVAVQMKGLAAMACAVASPDEARSPVAAREALVITDGSGRAAHVSGLQCFWILQQTVADLHGPVVVGRKRETRRARVPGIELEVITILVRLAPVEERAFELEPAIGEARRKDAEGDVRRILQVMRERRRGVFGRGAAMTEGSGHTP